MGCRGDPSSPEDRGIWRGHSALSLGKHMSLQKEVQDPEFDVKVAATGGNDRTTGTALCGNSVPATSHASCRNHLI